MASSAIFNISTFTRDSPIKPKSSFNPRPRSNAGAVWLSLVPFVTGWLGKNRFASLPTAIYGAVLLGAALAYWILLRIILHSEGPDSKLAKAIGGDLEGNLSLAGYIVAIPLAFVDHWISDALYVAIALVWLVPDKRIESKFSD